MRNPVTLQTNRLPEYTGGVKNDHADSELRLNLSYMITLSLDVMIMGLF